MYTWCWQLGLCVYFIFSSGGRGRPEGELFEFGSLKPGALAASPQGGGGWRIVWMLHVFEGLNGFWTWEVWRHEHLCNPLSPSSHLGIPFSSSHSAALSEGLRRKEECSGEKKVSKDASQIVSLGSGVKGQRGGGTSGVKWSREASGQFGKCLQDNLLTWDQVGTQSVWLDWDRSNRKEIRILARCEEKLKKTKVYIKCKNYNLNICYCHLLQNAKSENYDFCSRLCARYAKLWCGNSWELFSAHAQITDRLHKIFENFLASIQSQLCLLAKHLMSQRMGFNKSTWK